MEEYYKEIQSVHKRLDSIHESIIERLDNFDKDRRISDYKQIALLVFLMIYILVLEFYL